LRTTGSSEAEYHGGSLSGYIFYEESKEHNVRIELFESCVKVKRIASLAVTEEIRASPYYNTVVLSRHDAFRLAQLCEQGGLAGKLVDATINDLSSFFFPGASTRFYPVYGYYLRVGLP
jgi:hypothetical protein